MAMVDRPAGGLGARGQGESLSQGHPRKWQILVAVSLGLFMTLLDATIVNIAVPAIIADLHTTVTKVSWVLNAYSLTLGVLFLSMGKLGDRHGQKRLFLIGLGVFTLFSLACGLAPDVNWLIGFRVGQAVGGAVLAPISLALLLGVFPPQQRGVAIAVWGALGAAAAAVGPTLGGVLVTYGSWNWIFFVNVPIGIAALAAVFLVVPESKSATASGRVDFLGIVISIVGLFCLTLALLQGNEWGWGSVRIVGLLVVAAVAYPAFVWWELRVRDPMFDFRLLRIRSFTAANTAMLAIGAAMGGAIFLLVIFMVTVLGYSELRAGVVLTVMPGVALLLAPVIGRLVDRIGPRVPAAVGALFFTVGMLTLAQLDSSARAIDVAWRAAVLGLGIGFGMPTLSSAAVSSLPERSRGVGSGALNMMRQIGFVLGLAILVAVFTHTVAVQVREATRESVALVLAQQLPESAKERIVTSLQQNAAAAGQGGNPAARLKNPLGNAPQAPAGSPEAAAQEKLGGTITAIYRSHVADAFHLPYYVAALAAALGIVPAMLTGRRLGQYAGFEELSRAERSAAASET